MNKREKMLAAGVGLMLFAIGSVYLVNQLIEAFDTRETKISKLKQDIGKQERSIRFGKRAQRQMEEYLKRSLSSDRLLARNQYETWLLKQTVNAELQAVQVSPLPGREQGELYYRHLFSVNGRSNLEQLASFLRAFYANPTLHRISRLNAKPIPRTSLLDLSITIEALSLNAAPENQPIVEVETPQAMPNDPLAERVAYASIVRRNFFSPPNQPPTLERLRDQEVDLDESLSFTVRGSDADELDELTYALAGDVPEGARIDPETGEFRWSPEELGDFAFEIVVRDSGTPPQETRQELRIAVLEPPPEEAGFDPATQAFVTGIIEIGNERQVWVNLRTEGRVLRLPTGARLSIGSVDGVVQKIYDTSVEFQTEDGKSFSVRLGESLVPLDRDLRGI